MKPKYLIDYLSGLAPDCELAVSYWTKEAVEEMLNTKLTDDGWSRCIELFDDNAYMDEWYWIVESAEGEAK